MNDLELLADKVDLASHYRRSIRIDVDLGNPQALEGYICNRSSVAVVETMAMQVTECGHTAFTWTGPYGGGKSSLALTIASALHEDAELRSKAISRLDKSIRPLLKKAFPVDKGWSVIPVSGYKTNPVQLIAAQFAINCGKRIDPTTIAVPDLIDALLKHAKSKKVDGVFLVIDELGKLIEAATQGNGDINFFQDLAEAAARSSGKLVVVGILHQAFQQYVSKLSSAVRADWAKVQGRYVDIPLIASSDEVVDLIGKAITCKIQHQWTKGQSVTIAEQVKTSRSGLEDSFFESLEECWPLHPTMAVMLGPVSRRQFGQNERTIFGFLSTAEPYGFRHFLQNTKCSEEKSYSPQNFWDYLKANLEPIILTSVDSHKWAQANHIVQRVEAKGVDLEISLIKNIAVIDMFRTGSGIEATEKVLHSIYPKRKRKEIEEALASLVDQRVVLYRKHLSAWGLFDGSDFDIEEAVREAVPLNKLASINLIRDLIELHPIVAKKHYYETGALRWMSLHISDSECFESDLNAEGADNGLGKFLLVFPFDETSSIEIRKKIEGFGERPNAVVLGLAPKGSKALELASELSALNKISETNHTLVGDAVARREVMSRIAIVQSLLEDEIRAAIAGAEWWSNSQWMKNVKLSILATEEASRLYPDTPKVKSELVNRESLSTNAVKARRELLYRMLQNESQEGLGMEGWPAEKGLYESIIFKGGIHAKNSDEVWQLVEPNGQDPLNYRPLWLRTNKLISRDKTVGLQDIYDIWKTTPYGVKPGLAPLLLFAYIFGKKDCIAIYRDGMFVPSLTEANIDEALKDPSRFSLRKVEIGKDQEAGLEDVAVLLRDLKIKAGDTSPLSVARGLVTLAFTVPEWTRRTKNLSPKALVLRDLLLKASDPHKLLFLDLPEILKFQNNSDMANLLREPLSEIANCYAELLKEFHRTLFDLLKAKPLELENLHRRAELVEAASSDLRLNSFATRLKLYDGSDEKLESILSLAANKPSRNWNDSDIESVTTELARLATNFKQVETYAQVDGLDSTRETFAVVLGSGSATKTIYESHDLSSQEMKAAEKLSKRLLAILESESEKELVFAALAMAGASISEKSNG
jgi:hypothetical protein